MHEYMRDLIKEWVEDWDWSECFVNLQANGRIAQVWSGFSSWNPELEQTPLWCGRKIFQKAVVAISHTAPMRNWVSLWKKSLRIYKYSSRRSTCRFFLKVLLYLNLCKSYTRILINWRLQGRPESLNLESSQVVLMLQVSGPQFEIQGSLDKPINPVIPCVTNAKSMAGLMYFFVL